MFALTNAIIVSLDTNADTLLSLSAGKVLGLDTQTANYVFAGATSGGAAVPTFRALVAADLPTVTVAKGGTGKTSWTANGIVYADTAASLSQLASVASAVLVTNGSGTPSLSTDIPTAVTIGSAYVYRASGTDVPITDGGTGASTAETAATNLGLGTGDSPQFTAVNIGHASDTTLSRKSAGVLQVEANEVYVQNGTDVAVGDGGTGKSTWNANSLIYSSGQTALANLATVGSSGAVVQSGGSGAAPAWSTWTAPTTVAAGSVLAANSANVLSAVTSASGTYALQNAAGTISWASYTKLITANTTLYIATTGSDTTGDGSSGTPWATVSKALTYLDDYFILPSVTVTIQLAAGTYTVASAITVAHPCARNIIIQGTYTAGDHAKTMSSVQSSSGSASAWSIVINLNDVTNIAADDYVCVTAASGGTGPSWMTGCHKVTNVDSGNSRITITSAHTHSSAPSGNVAATVKVLKTVLSCSGDGFSISSASFLGGLKYLVIVKPAANNGLTLANRGGVVCTAPFGIVGAAASDSGNGVSAVGQAFASLVSATISGCYIGILCNHASYVAINSGVVSGGKSTGYGISASYHGAVNAASAVVTGNGAYGLSIDSTGMCYANWITVSACTTGIYAARYGYVMALASSLSDNGTDANPTVNTQGNEYGYIDT